MKAILRSIFLLVLGPPLADAADPPAHRVFPASRSSVDEILGRPYTPEVPFGSTGDRLWASSPQGWAFADDVHWLYLTNLKAFDLEIRDEHGLLQPSRATSYTSHVHLEGARRALTASASFTFRTDSVRNPIERPFRPEKRWTCWSSGRREDWYAVDFGAPRRLDGLKVYFFDDAPGGECRPPERFDLERWEDGNWIKVEPLGRRPEQPAEGENGLSFEPLTTEKVRLVFRHAGERFYTGLYGIEPHFADPGPAERASPLEITADKFITPDDILVSVVRVHNGGDRPRTIRVAPILEWTWKGDFQYRKVETSGTAPAGEEPPQVTSLWVRADIRLHDQDVRRSFRFAAATDPPTSRRVRGAGGLAGEVTIDPFPRFLRSTFREGYAIGPGETWVFKAALELRPPDETEAIDRVLKPADAAPDGGQVPPDRQDARDPLADQIKHDQGWFDKNLAYFDCSDPWVRKLYEHRAYVLRKNMLDPKLGRMEWPTQAEGRWRSTWYPNVISYGAAHQVREARWLRDPRYWQGHLRTWVENQKADHVYPSHVTPKGPSGGQYTDWISSTAWDGHLVHPDKEFLAAIVDKLAENVRGWQKVYDPDDDGLLLVDSHWWTGMEYQPSFFYFSDYKVAKDFLEPEKKVSLERVDLTAYNFGNAVVVAKIYRLLGQPGKAEEFEKLAAKIAGAVARKMWQPEKKFFYSLKADDDAVADVKEVIGVYPFYFGMFPSGRGFESAWASILDPEQFWTPWPVASASKQCPAYSQANWPNDGRRAACMWNGPTWPHANAIVLTAMARTIRADRDQERASSPLTKNHLWQLFHSFTRAQYRDQDINNPWTGEFYDGETGHWKTAERDYNHSTWLDILIPEIVGLVPRDDDVLEVDPLVPPGALSYFLLDGQAYRGRDVTIAWDAPGGPDRFGDGRKGLDVYLDGKLAASAEGLGRLRLDLGTGKAVGSDE